MPRVIASIGLMVVMSTSAALADAAADCYQTNDLDRTINGCSKFIREDPKSADAYYRRGEAYRGKGDNDRAMVDYTKAIELDPKFMFAYVGRGFAYQTKGDNDRAMVDYTKAIELDPKLMSAYVGRGDTYQAKGDNDKAIADYNTAIELDPKNADAYYRRGFAYQTKGDHDRAMVDYTTAIELDPKFMYAYVGRGEAYRAKGDNDRAIAEYNTAIELDPKYADAYTGRGIAYQANGDNDRAIADTTKAIELNPKYAIAYYGRGEAYRAKGDNDRAIAEYNTAMEIDPKNAYAHLGLGRVYLSRSDYDRAIAELSEAMRLAPKDPRAFAERAAAYEAKGQIDRAISDYRAAQELPAKWAAQRQAYAEAGRRLAAIENRKQTQELKAADTSAAKPMTISPGRRVALVIANSNYGSVGRLTNPANDGRALAASFRRLGFADVIERYDLGQNAMVKALREFGDKATGAEWAVVYYAGHGVEMNGVAYLIPVDATLERDTYVADETVALDRVLDKVEGAQKLRLVILDACRNNPFVARMVRSAGSNRSIGRGLGQIEPEGGVLVAYSAKHGTTAEDGSGANSPFAEALVANMEEPGLEINFLFRKVRDQVLAKTGKRQEPYLYGSLPSESLFFRNADAR